MARADQRTQKILYKVAEMGIPRCRSSNVPAPQITGTHVCFRSHRDGEVTLILKSKHLLGGTLDCVVSLRSLAVSICTLAEELFAGLADAAVQHRASKERSVQLPHLEATSFALADPAFAVLGNDFPRIVFAGL